MNKSSSIILHSSRHLNLSATPVTLFQGWQSNSNIDITQFFNPRGNTFPLLTPLTFRMSRPVDMINMTAAQERSD